MAGEMLSCATARPDTTHHSAATTASVDAERRERCMMPPARRVRGGPTGPVIASIRAGVKPTQTNGARGSFPGRRRSFGHANGVPLLICFDLLRERTGHRARRRLHRRRRRLEALGGLDLDLVVPVDPGPSRDEVADDDVLFQPQEVVPGAPD